MLEAPFPQDKIKQTKPSIDDFVVSNGLPAQKGKQNQTFSHNGEKGMRLMASGPVVSARRSGCGVVDAERRSAKFSVVRDQARIRAVRLIRSA